jgi:hypothetical protein
MTNKKIIGLILSVLIILPLILSHNMNIESSILEDDKLRLSGNNFSNPQDVFDTHLSLVDIDGRIEVSDFELDSHGNIFVTGKYSGAPESVISNNYSCPDTSSTDNYDCTFFGKLDSEGVWIFLYVIGRGHSQLEVDFEGNVVLFMHSATNITIGQVLVSDLTTGGDPEEDLQGYFVGKFSSDGTLLWSYDGRSDQLGRMLIDTDSNGNIFFNMGGLGNQEIDGQTVTQNSDVLFKLTPDGDLEWISHFNKYNIVFYSLIITEQDKIVLHMTGTSEVYVNDGALQFDSRNQHVAEISTNNIWLWSLGFACGHGYEVNIDSNSNGDILLLTEATGSDCSFGPQGNSISPTSNQRGDVVLAQITENDTTNSFEWTSVKNVFNARSNGQLKFLYNGDDSIFIVTTLYGSSPSYIPETTVDNQKYKPSHGNSILLIVEINASGEVKGHSGDIKQYAYVHTYPSGGTWTQSGLDILSTPKIHNGSLIIGTYMVGTLLSTRAYNAINATGVSAFVILEFSDFDFDGVNNLFDNCITSYSQQKQYSNNIDGEDPDFDGCMNFEDDDDDNDGFLDEFDTLCQYQYYPGNEDYDADGCQENIDDDDDNDGIYDSQDKCPRGFLGWNSFNEPIFDYDGDGCHDEHEDNDWDDDLIENEIDYCPKGELNWYSYSNTDFDADGCKDNSIEDDDNDNDGVLNDVDVFPRNASEFSDYDNDGIGDNADIDDDNDNFTDNEDSCPLTFGASTNGVLGCVDSDGDGFADIIDECSMNFGESFIDRNGCLDQDSDGVSDLNDIEPYNSEIGLDEYDGPRNDDIQDQTNDSQSNASAVQENISQEQRNTSTNQESVPTNQGNSAGGLENVGVFSIGGILLTTTVVFFFIRSRRSVSDGDDNQLEESTETLVHDNHSINPSNTSLHTGSPEFSLTGEIHESGYEVLEYPPNSGNWWWKDSENECWVYWE